MLGAATPALAINVSRAGGIGFLAGRNNMTDIHEKLKATTSLIATHDIKNHHFETSDRLPIGIGFQNWDCKIDLALEATEKHRPSAIWLYAPKKTEDLKEWARGLRSVSNGKVSVWVQVETVKEAMDAIDTADPDVLVIRGSDAGGHGLARSASIISLLPEVADILEDRNRDLQSLPLLAA
ncbi:hypothetical protein EYC80_002805 [Monilinia laxa]|uniref:Uncharacterized protein n=1 Tax=Monilinia laxa TaxID=61186 RepID=A0A5N6KBV7_MONLA|nr:hypothetical protein EYC80_002805 [Monilinia laxa]